MSKIETNTIAPSTGTTLTIGENGDTVQLGTGATQSGFGGTNTPSFSANKISGSISFSRGVFTKMPFDNELYDTNSAYDTSNYRFTVPSGHAGKYNFTAHFMSYEQSNSNISEYNVAFYKNGSLEVYLVQSESANHGSYRKNMISADLDLAVGDYIELYARLSATAGTARVETGQVYNRFSGHKLIG